MIYRSEIDGLRALAVLPVIFFHAGFTSFSGGYVGVDIFFVISGYLITSIIINEKQNNNFSLINFYERRARRILPALFLVMLISMPLGWFLMLPDQFTDFGKSLYATSLFSSNILFWLQSGYFDGPAELKPLLHTWSLAVEEQYYLFFPILVMIIWNLGKKWMILLISLIGLVSLVFAQIASYESPSANFYLLPTRIWELVLGVLSAFYLFNKPPGFNILNKNTSDILSILGLGMIVFSVFIFNKFTPFPSFYSLLPTIGTLLIILFATKNTRVGKVLSFSPLVGVGLISYSLYLWHQPLLAFGRIRNLGTLSNSETFFLIGISFILAFISWKYLEKSFRNRKGFFTRKKIFIFSFLGIIFFSFSGLLISLNEGYKNRYSVPEDIYESFKKPSLTNCFDLDNIHLVENWGCKLGKEKEKIDYLLLGDSHSLSLKDIFHQAGITEEKQIFFTGASGCPPLINLVPAREDQANRDCKKLNERVQKFAVEQGVKHIFLVARWSYYTDGGYDSKNIQYLKSGQLTTLDKATSRLVFEKSLRSTLEFYKSKKITVHIITQVPSQEVNAKDAFFIAYRNYKRNTEVSLDESLSKFSIDRKKHDRLQLYTKTVFKKNSSDMIIYDFDHIFCKNKCLLGDSEGSFYYDDHHLSTNGAALIEDNIKSIFKDLD